MNNYQLFAIVFPALLIQSKVEVVCDIKTLISPGLFLKSIYVDLKYSPKNTQE